MRAIRIIRPLVAACFLALGCGGTATGPAEDLASVQAAIEQDSGGFAPNDEAPMFGDEALHRAIAQEFDRSGSGEQTPPRPEMMLEQPTTDDVCDRAAMAGRWRVLAKDFGVFRGHVIGEDRGVRGHVRGIFGVRKDGKHVFFGKLIGLHGRFVGFIGGGFRDGKFAGVWKLINREAGTVGGISVPAPVDSRGIALPHGFFIGLLEEKTCDASGGTLDDEPMTSVDGGRD